MRKEGTEPAYSSKFNFEKASGTYVCKGCDTPLFKSNHKYDSGSGWPSFYQTIDENVSYSIDYKIGYARTEEHCSNCGSHLGHVFNDGPKPTGKDIVLMALLLNSFLTKHIVPNNSVTISNDYFIVRFLFTIRLL